MAAGAASYKNPPVLDTSDYETWRNEIDIWKLMTDLDKKKQALAVTLSLKGQARATALEIKADDLNKDEGMSTLLKALDAVYKKDEIDLAYAVYTNFEKYKRYDRQNISQYIVEFERLYHLCKKHKMELPDTVLSFKLLDNAGLDPKDRKLALTAASDLKWNSMKSALKRIFGESTAGDLSAAEHGINIKQENAFYTTGTGIGKPNYRNNYNYRNKEQNNSRTGTSRGTNPMDRYGRRSRCAICSSVFHWAKNCEHKNKNEEQIKLTEEQVKLTKDQSEGDQECVLTTETPDCSNLVFMTEAYGTAVIDTACTRTVCGTKWLEDYVDTLSKEQKSEIAETMCERYYRFGDGVRVAARKNVTLPAYFGKQKYKISADVVDKDLPLLLSKHSLKQAEAVIDMVNDEVTFFGNKIELEQTASGHYCVDLRRKIDMKDETVHQVLAVIETEDPKEKERIAKKLHRQFGHASEEKLKKLMSDAGVKDQELYKMFGIVIEKCEVCAKYSKTPSRPAVCLPMASDFNETVAMDLHQLEGALWVLHLIDMFTRLSSGVLVKSKEGQVIVDAFIKKWIGTYGAPKKILSDNGGEFENEEMKQMAHMFGIEILTTAAYSPWSNGVCERHNLTLSETIKKVKEDRNCSWELALQWALMAKNSLSNIHGYSAYQLVFGRNPNLPSVIHDKLPALEGATSSVNVGQHIASMYAARRAFTEAESSERIRRALRRQTRSSRDEIYSNGEKVFYKRPDRNEWRGPGRVIGQDGVVVFMRHGGQLVRVHVCRIKRVKETEERREQETEREEVSDRQTEEMGPEEDHEDDEDDIMKPKETEKTNRSEEIQEEENSGRQPRDEHGGERTSSRREQTAVKLKPGQHIAFKTSENEEEQLGTVISRAGKCTGKNRNWYNIGCDDKDGGTKTFSINTNAVSELRVVDLELETSQEEDVLVVKEDTFEKAKIDEMESWKRNEVYEVVENTGQQAISTRWICSLKDKEGKVVQKARLVARGFEEIDNMNIQKDSPTCASESLKVVLSVIAQNGWKPRTMDIKTAFLQGNKINRNVYIKPPKEAEEKNKLWRLNKCVYGLSDASLQWYRRVKSVMTELGAEISKVDPAVFIWNKGGRLEGILACHVDDFIWAGIDGFERVIEQVRKKFVVGREEKHSFNYVGLEIHHGVSEEIKMNQNRYAENINPIEMSKTRSMQKESEITEGERTEMRSKIGQLLWIARQTRPDVMFDTTYLAGRVKSGRVQDLLEVNKVVKRVKTEKLSLTFHKLNGELRILVYTDASLGNLQDSGSQGAQIICLYGIGGKINPLWWSSKKIRRIVRSTLAAETVALAEGMDMGIFLATLYSEITKGKADPKQLPLICRVDCKSLSEALYSTKELSEKRLRLDMAGIKEQLVGGQIERVEWISSENQLADSLTKKGASSMKLLKALEKGRIDE